MRRTLRKKSPGFKYGSPGTRLWSGTSVLLLSIVACIICFSYEAGRDEKTIKGSSHANSAKISASSSPEDQKKAVEGLLQRLLGVEYLDYIAFEVVGKERCDGQLCFEVQNAEENVSGNKKARALIRISGTSGVELAAGLHWYLKHKCGAHISWAKTGGSQLSSVPPPPQLPRLKLGESFVKVRAVHWSYYQTVNTFTYSSVWWDWPRWEEEIDWMALQGVNMPLALIGQEAITRSVLTSAAIALTDADLASFFTGPAFLAWNRQGRLRGLGGPLPIGWMDAQLELQKRIIARMRSYGMIPVLPAFMGHVPPGLRRRFPKANIVESPGAWFSDAAANSTFLLDPHDDLFTKISRAFIQKQIEVYGGTNHIYSSSLVSYGSVAPMSTSHISNVASAVFAAMRAGDPGAIWLLQSSALDNNHGTHWRSKQIRAVLYAVPRGSLIVVDTAADFRPAWEATRSFYGVPFIWCMQHNFGGTMEMFGDLATLAEEPVRARSGQESSMVGVGMCPDGIEQNPIVFELMAEMAFHEDAPALGTAGPGGRSGWVQSYVTRRYGGSSPLVEEAWEILRNSVYNCSDRRKKNNNVDVVVHFPDIPPSIFKVPHPELLPGPEGSLYGYGPEPHVRYRLGSVFRAWGLLLKAAKQFNGTRTYMYDIADVSRQVLSKSANLAFERMMVAFLMGNAARTQAEGRNLLMLLGDLEELARTQGGLLLGTWVESARSAAPTPADGELFERGARMLLTGWRNATNGGDTFSYFNDYANRHWSGLIGGFYLPRWEIFVSVLVSASEQSLVFPYDEWRNRVAEFTRDWQEKGLIYPTTPQGDTYKVALRCFRTWIGVATRWQSGSLIDHIASHV